MNLGVVNNKSKFFSFDHIPTYLGNSTIIPEQLLNTDLQKQGNVWKESVNNSIYSINKVILYPHSNDVNQISEEILKF